MSGHSDAQG